MTPLNAIVRKALTFFVFSSLLLVLLPTNVLANTNYGEDLYGNGYYGGAAPTPVPTNSYTGCGDASPGSKAPWLYGAISQSSTSVKLYFTAAAEPVSKYVLEYGTKSGEYQYGVQDLGVNSRGSMTFLVEKLSPNTTYYFRVRAGNGCATGPWSNELSNQTQGIASLAQLEVTDFTVTPQEAEKDCQTHTVGSGDTLWSIAQELLGDGSRYPELMEQNKEKYTSLADSPKLTVGWELTTCKEKKTEACEEGTTVNVKVLDTKQKPVEGATVTIHSEVQKTQTNKEGLAEFACVEPGDHKVLIAYQGFQGEQAVNLTGDVKEININVTIQKKAVTFTPLVYGVMGGMALVIATLALLLVRMRRKIKLH